jgi:hypothetical protein
MLFKRKEYDSLLAEQNKKREEFIATHNAENAKKLEVLRASGLSDEVITILAPMLLSSTFAEVKNLAKSKSKK